MSERLYEHLSQFVEAFLFTIMKTGPMYSLELMTLVYLMTKTNKHAIKQSKDILINKLFISWLKTASYPANFVIIKFLNDCRSILSANQWRIVQETASELDHEQFSVIE